MTAAERFERLYLNAIKYVCNLEAELEQARTRISELEQQAEEAPMTNPTPRPDGLSESRPGA